MCRRYILKISVGIQNSESAIIENIVDGYDLALS